MFSSTGKYSGSPYTAEVDAKINFLTNVFLHASIIATEALKFVVNIEFGFSKDEFTLASAAK